MHALQATLLIRVLAKLGVAHFARKYPGVKDALLRSVLETACAYHRALAGEVVSDRHCCMGAWARGARQVLL